MKYPLSFNIIRTINIFIFCYRFKRKLCYSIFPPLFLGCTEAIRKLSHGLRRFIVIHPNNSFQWEFIGGKTNARDYLRFHLIRIWNEVE